MIINIIIERVCWCNISWEPASAFFAALDLNNSNGIWHKPFFAIFRYDTQQKKDINCARRPHVNIYHFLFNSFRENFSRFSNGGDPGKDGLLFPPLCWTISHPFQYIAQYLGCFEENQEWVNKTCSSDAGLEYLLKLESFYNSKLVWSIVEIQGSALSFTKLIHLSFGCQMIIGFAFDSINHGGKLLNAAITNPQP